MGLRSAIAPMVLRPGPDRTVIWIVVGFCSSHNFIFSDLELICKERKQRRRRKRKKTTMVDETVVVPRSSCCFFFFSVCLHYVVSHFLVPCFVHFLTFPRDYWLTLVFEILKTTDFWIKDELNPFLLFSFGLWAQYDVT